MINLSPIRDRFVPLSPHLDERERRLLAATEAWAAGYGKIASVARATGIAVGTGRTFYVLVRLARGIGRGTVSRYRVYRRAHGHFIANGAGAASDGPGKPCQDDCGMVRPFTQCQ